MVTPQNRKTQFTEKGALTLSTLWMHSVLRVAESFPYAQAYFSRNEVS